MESTDIAELKRRDDFFKQDPEEIRRILLLAIRELPMNNDGYIWVEDIDKYIHKETLPDIEERKIPTKLPDERYKPYLLYLRDRGYITFSSIKVYPRAKALDWEGSAL